MIAGLEWDYKWSEKAVEKFIECWKSGMDDREIARYLRRRYAEVVVLRLDLDEQKRLPKQGSDDDIFPQPRKRNVSTKGIDLEFLRNLYLDSSITIAEIARIVGCHKRSISLVVQRERVKNPELWPQRIKFQQSRKREVI